MAVRVGHFVLPGISIGARGDNYWLTLYNNRQEESPDPSELSIIVAFLAVPRS